MSSTRTTFQVRPHTSSPRLLAEQAKVYRSGRTPDWMKFKNPKTGREIIVKDSIA